MRAIRGGRAAIDHEPADIVLRAARHRLRDDDGGPLGQGDDATDVLFCIGMTLGLGRWW